MGRTTVPFVVLSSSSYALMVIFLLGSTAYSKNPNARTSFSVKIFKPAPPLMRTLLMRCLWMKATICRGVLWGWDTERSSCSVNDMVLEEVKLPTMVWNFSWARLVGTVVSTKAFSRISLWDRDRCNNSKIEMWAEVFYNWSMTLYWRKLDGEGDNLGGVVLSVTLPLRVMILQPVLLGPDCWLGVMTLT